MKKAEKKATTRKTARPTKEGQKDRDRRNKQRHYRKPVGFESHGRPSRKHGFREASDERRSGKHRDCHCECCCTKAKTDNGQDETVQKLPPSKDLKRKRTERQPELHRWMVLRRRTDEEDDGKN